MSSAFSDSRVQSAGGAMMDSANPGKMLIVVGGLIALAGTMMAIDEGKISEGSKVLCALTSGISEADGKAEPEMRITTLADLTGSSERIK